MKYFRKEKGLPSNSRRLIGRLDAEGKRLAPNDNYYELYGHGPETLFVPMQESVISIEPHFFVSQTLSRLARVFHESGVGSLNFVKIQSLTEIFNGACHGKLHSLEQNSTTHDATQSVSNFFKIGTCVARNTRRIRFLLFASYPYKELFELATQRLKPG